MPKEKLLSTRETADILKVSIQRVRQFYDEGRIPATCVGSSLVFLKSDVRAFKKIRRIPGRPPGDGT